MLGCGLNVIWLAVGVIIGVYFGFVIACCFVVLRFGWFVLISFVAVLYYGGFVNSVDISCL